MKPLWMIVVLLVTAMALVTGCGSDTGSDAEVATDSPLATSTVPGSPTGSPSVAMPSKVSSSTSVAQLTQGQPTESTPPQQSAPTEEGSVDPVPEPTEEPPAEPEVVEEPTATPDPPAPAEPVVVSSGSFVSIGYDGSGTALVVEQPDGSYVIQFADDFTVENGPALVIYLSTTTDLSDGGVLSSDNVNLGSLQATEGFQEYTVPAGVDPTLWSSVIVWCEEFDVGFVGALLTT